MNIIIDTEDLPSAFYWDPRTYFRGTEEFYVETAESMVRKGHDVNVWMDREDTLIHNGVMYLPREVGRRMTYPSANRALVCNGPHQHPFNTRVVNWTNFAQFPKDAFSQTHPLVLLTQAHFNLVKPNHHNVHVVGHGLPPHFPRWTGGAKENLAIYTSSPDRGGKWLEAVWPQVEKATGTRLEMVYGGKTRAEMVDLYHRAAFWIHPGAGVELFCLSGQKALAAGCTPIYGVGPRSKALQETIQPLSGVGPIKMSVETIVDRIRSTNTMNPLSCAESVPTVDEPTEELLKLLEDGDV